MKLDQILFLLRRSLFAFGIFFTTVFPTYAVIIYGTQGMYPAELEGYVGRVAGASGTFIGYYGDGYWVLTANHVGIGNFIVNGETYSYIVNSGIRIGSLDLYAFKIDVPVDSYLAGLDTLILSSSTPADNSEVEVAGFGGGDREASITKWRVNGTTWTESNLLPTHSGYKYTPDIKEWSWGKNEIESTVKNGVRRRKFFSVKVED